MMPQLEAFTASDGSVESRTSDLKAGCCDFINNKTDPAWFPCPGCDRMVTSLTYNSAFTARHHIYSPTHCCVDCEHGASRGHCEDPWSCAGVPRGMFKELWLSGVEAPAHYLLHDPGPKAGAGSRLPAILFLHGSMTYLYPETLWWDVRDFIERNHVAREHFVLVAPFASAGEPIAKLSSWTKPNRFGVDVPYIESFDADHTWATFLGAVGSGRVDTARFHVVGFSLGGQAAWNLALRYGSQLASIVPIAGCCSWPQDSWAMQDACLNKLRRLVIWCYCGELDTQAVSWRDLWWLADSRGLAVKPKVGFEQKACGTELLVHEWDCSLRLSLLRGDAGTKCHCIWNAILHHEDAFSLCRRLLGVRCPVPLLTLRGIPDAFPASRDYCGGQEAKP